ncbi:hypothetical protein [Micromonospora sp. KC213]|uniref:hypothetical protein n=1 Tax=Micromonospora sp. KC213 TaxID=2530378 RepID=UPI0010438E91|nr:hypothetical protein [Micromonospora sp. KC213]TDC35716.1 hypothetical protein E1166_23250 [Micromonospora sp. KC213]
MTIRQTTRALTGEINAGDVSTLLGHRPGREVRAASLHFHPQTRSGVLSITDPAVADALAEELRQVAAYLRGEES